MFRDAEKALRRLEEELLQEEEYEEEELDEEDEDEEEEEDEEDEEDFDEEDEEALGYVRADPRHVYNTDRNDEDLEELSRAVQKPRGSRAGLLMAALLLCTIILLGLSLWILRIRGVI